MIAAHLTEDHFPHRLSIHWLDVAKVWALVEQHKHGRCRVVDLGDGEFQVECAEAFDAADIRIAFPRSRYLKE